MGIPLKINTFTTPNKLLNTPLASCSLRNFNFLLLHTAHFDKRIILPFLVFTTYFYTLNNKTTLFYIQFKFLFVNRIFEFFLYIIKFFQHIIY